MVTQDVFGIVGTTQAGNFHVERVVAEGGFGVVYRAHHGGFRAPVAIKCLKIPEQMSKQQRDIFLEKFREEAELMFRLSASIVEVCRPLHVDVLQLGDGRFVPFLAMEWLEGESLDAIITRRREQKQSPLGLHKVVKMMRPVATALARAHRFPGPEGTVAIIHRDLKPENLMVATIGGAESMKILDYGIAKAKRAASQAAGRVTGLDVAEDEMASFTPAYGAPEQWAPKSWGETGPWTDVWGLALSMSEALCGYPPIDGEPWMMRRICLDEKRRPTPRNHGAEIPVAVEKAFEQALAIDPRQRFKTVESFWSELERAMGLPPTLGPRDDRCEPGVPRAVTEAPPPPRPAPVAGERLARIELQKINVPAIAARAPKLPSKPGKEAPGSDPGSSGELPPSPASPAAAPPATRAMSSSSNGPSNDRAPAAEAWELDLTAAAGRADPPPVAAPPSQGSLEMSLPTRSDPPPPMGGSQPGESLEMSLPTRSDPPPAGAAPGPGPAAPAPAPAPRAVASEASLDGASVPDPRAKPRPPAEAAPMSFDLQHAPAAAPAPLAAKGGPRLPPAAGRAVDRAPGPVRRPDFPGTRAPVRHVAEASDVRDRLRAPLGTLLLALAVASAELGYHRFTGGDLMLGPVRPFWIAAPLAIFGVGFTLYRLMEDRSDG